MFRASTLCSLLILSGAAILLAGCGKTPDKPTAKEPAGAAKTAPDAGAAAPGEKPAALTAEDRALIAKQKVCPVTGAELGSMGDPVKVVVKGQTVFLCCSGCEDAIKKDPDKYLAELSSAGEKK